MATKIATASSWQRNRAIEIHTEFVKAERRMRLEHQTQKDAIAEVCEALKNKTVRKGTHKGKEVYKSIAASHSTLVQMFNKWRDGGQTVNALLLQYKPGQEKIPRELIAELHRLSTVPGMANISVVVKKLQDLWKAGYEIPGLGGWQNWWANRYPNAELPLIAPDFPYSERTLYRHQPSKRERALGNKGFAEFKGKAPFVSLDYSILRKCELFVLDDVRLDIICIDESTGKAIEVICYVMMEVSSRSIAAFLMKPAAAIKQEDVDELIAHGLRTWGIGDGYSTHVKLERGTVAMTEAAQITLEAATERGIQIHRTSMNGGVRWVGAARDKKSGHAAGKAVIESFNRKLHLMLMNLPGQRGNNFRNQPANLGYEGANNITPGSLIDQAQKLAQFQLAAGSRVRLQLPMLYLKELHQMVRAAIKNHNHEPGHDYQGHGSFTERETSPGVWTR